MNYEIIPEKTAIVNGVSTSCKELVDDYKNGFVLDYGFGKLRNSKYIKENNIPLDILDTKLQIDENYEKINLLNIKNIYESKDSLKESYYSYILLSFVLNVVSDKNERVFILNNIKQGLSKDGKVYIEVRNNSFVKNLKSKEEYNDGYIIGVNKKTFQKPYTEKDIVEFVKENGFNVLKVKKTSGSIMLVCSKK